VDDIRTHEVFTDGQLGPFSFGIVAPESDAPKAGNFV